MTPSITLRLVSNHVLVPMEVVLTAFSLISARGSGSLRSELEFPDFVYISIMFFEAVGKSHFSP